MKVIKKQVLLFFYLALISNIYLFAESNEKIDLEYYSIKVFTLMENFSMLIENNTVNTIVYETYLVSDTAIRQNNVTLSINPDLNTVLSGMEFSYNESGEIGLVFGLRFLETYFPGSSIHYAIMMHEYRHLHDYLTNRLHFIDAKNNIFGVYRYELDAYRVQAEFINDYLNQLYDLSRFELYLLNSFKNDNLNSASIILLREGMNVYFRFNRLENAFFNNNISADDTMAEIYNWGISLINLYHEAEEDFDKYYSYIELATFRKYMLALIPGIINNPTMTWEEVFHLYPGIEEIYSAITLIQNSDNEFHTEYLRFIIDIWEDDIIN